MSRRWLAPLTPLYAAGAAWRNRQYDSGAMKVSRLQWPVVSIGNLSTGGAGKTPLTITLARALTSRGVAVDVLSRGYGRRGDSAMRVNPQGTADEFGDEPLLIADAAAIPVYVAKERHQAGLLAEREATDGAAMRVHLLDDGFQHRGLHRDVNVLILSSEHLRDRLLPAGNLREPFAAIARADIVAVDEADKDAEDWFGRPVAINFADKSPRWRESFWRLRRRMSVPEVDGRVIAFCGIAKPEQFFTGLEAAGVRIAARMAYADHFRYEARHLEEMASLARRLGASTLLTTEKDRVRLRGLESAMPQNLRLATVELMTEILNQDAVMDELIARLKQPRV